MTPEFKAGYVAAAHADNDLTLDNKSTAFIAGYTQGMRDQSALADQPDIDSYDF